MFLIPSILNSKSVSTFLSDYTQILKKAFGPEKLKDWALRSGMQSRTKFKNVVTGLRQISPQMQKALEKTLDLSASEIHALSSNVKVEVATETPIYFVSDDFFASPLNTIVINLCGIQSAMNEHKIAATLKGLFSEQQVHQSIQSLLANELIKKCEDDTLTRVFEGRISTLPGQKSNSSQQYFSESYRMAEMAWNFPLPQREIGAFTFRIHSQDVPKMKEAVRRFRNEVSTLSGTREAANSVYHCSVAAFPIYLEEENH